MAKPSRMQLVVLGCGGVGKSSCTIQFVQRRFVDTYDPTIQDSYNKIEQVDGRAAVLTLCDTAGQVEFAQFRVPYIRNADGVLLMYSVTDAASFRELGTFLREIAGARAGRSGCGPCPCVVFANKTDLAHSRRVTCEEGERWALSAAAGGVVSTQYVEGSSMSFDDVQRAWHALICEVWRQRGEPVAVVDGSAPRSSGLLAVPRSDGQLRQQNPLQQEQQQQQQQQEEGGSETHAVEFTSQLPSRSSAPPPQNKSSKKDSGGSKFRCTML